MAAGSIGKSEGQKKQEMHPPSPHAGVPIQGRIHRPGTVGK